MKTIEDERIFQEARKRTVAKRVDAIQKGRNAFTLVETKAINYMLSKIRPDDKPDTVYTFNTLEFCRMIQWKRTPTKELLGMLQTISKKNWWIEKTVGKGKKQYDLHHWFDIVSLNEGTGTISVSFSKTVQPYIFDLIEQKKKNNIYFASWRADAISLMKNPYAPRLFELLKSLSNNKAWTFENGTGSDIDLQIILANTDDHGNPLIPKSWSNWSLFNRYVLVPSKEEINKYTDLVIDYTPCKCTYDGTKTRKISSIVFDISEKTALEQERKDQEISVVYDSDDITDIDDASIKDSDNFSSKRKRAKEISKEYYRQRNIENSKYPILMDSFPELSEEQISLLASECLKYCPEEIRVSRNKDLWQADYLAKYYQYIKASDNTTKSSLFARLYDCISKDYKGFSKEISSHYLAISHKQNISPALSKETIIDSRFENEDNVSRLSIINTPAEDDEKEEQLLELVRRVM